MKLPNKNHLLILLLLIISISIVVIPANANQSSDIADRETIGFDPFDFSAMQIQNYYGMNPFNPDTTNDGLSDADQLRFYGSNPKVNDTTGDGVTDVSYVRMGLSPTKIDYSLWNHTEKIATQYDNVHTSNPISNPEINTKSEDGFSDTYEITNQFLDRDKIDMFIQLQQRGAGSIKISEVVNIIQYYNIDAKESLGYEPFDIHIYIDEEKILPAEEKISIEEYEQVYLDNRKPMMHHTLITEKEPFPSLPSIEGVSFKQVSGSIVTGDRDWQLTGSTLMHEMAHMTGLQAADLTGVDSTIYSWEDYPSIMGYNSPENHTDLRYNPDCNNYSRTSGENLPLCYTYADKDWEFIVKNYQPPLNG